jgi:YrbI family 3-deoxy-D-manno-octulosonate 8-phosphate phosphatase
MPERIRALIVIPARGGSKGIPQKNLQPVQDRSLITRAVTAALAANVGRVVVTTDNDAIAAQARAAGAEIIERPASLSGDTASTESALLHVLDTLEARGETLPDLLVLVQCTSPFVTAQDIAGTLGRMDETGADTAHSVVQSHGFLWRQSGNGAAEGINHDKSSRPRRQDRDPEYLETGGVYAMRLPGFRTARHRFFGKTVLYPVSPLRALEIDTPDDLVAARLLAPLASQDIPPLPDPLHGIVFDFDGVMTDDRVIVSEMGEEAVVCSRADGLGIERLRARGLRMAVISRERNPVVARRCAKLELECIQASTDKETAFRAFCAEWGTAPSQVIFVGNDLPDNACLMLAGLGVAVADAHPETRAIAGLTLTRAGGHGAVRELCDLVLAAIDGRER